MSAKIDGISGESTTRAGEIGVKSFSFGGKSPPSGGGGGSGKQFANVRFSKLYDSASPALMLKMASGQHIKSVTFTFARPGTNGATILTYKLSDVIVAGYEHGGDANPPITAGWDVKSNVSV